MCNVLLASAIQQSESVTYIYTYIIYHSFLFFSHRGHDRVLSRVPCAIQWVLIINSYQLYKWVLSLGWEDPLEEGVATHFSNLAWRIPMDRGAWQAYSPHGCRESDTTEATEHAFYIY